MVETALHYFNLITAFCLLITMLMMFIRLFTGPSLYDRLLAVNSLGTKTIIFLCLFCFIIGRPDGLDIAILYGLMNFIATIAVLKFFRYRSLTLPLQETQHHQISRRSTSKSGTHQTGGST